MSGRLASRNKTDYLFIFPIDMTYNQHAQRGAESQQNKSVFFLGVVGIMFQSGVFVGKYR